MTFINFKNWCSSLTQVSIWTIGHSNRTIESFINLLREHKIRVLADVRRFPTSKVEHFKREQMERWLPETGINYIWLGETLGGYRHGGYKAYVKTDLFKRGIDELLNLAKNQRVCICCMEKEPQHCHRQLISRHLEKLGVKVVHILEEGRVNRFSR